MFVVNALRNRPSSKLELRGEIEWTAVIKAFGINNKLCCASKNARIHGFGSDVRLIPCDAVGFGERVTCVCWFMSCVVFSRIVGTTVRLVCVFARNQSLRTSLLFMSRGVGLIVNPFTRLLNHHDPVHVTSSLCLSSIVRLFHGSTTFRPAFAPLVSCLATISASCSEGDDGFWSVQCFWTRHMMRRVNRMTVKTGRVRCAQFNTPPRLHAHTLCSYAVVQLNKDFAACATQKKIETQSSSLPAIHEGPLHVSSTFFEQQLREFSFLRFFLQDVRSEQIR